MQTYSRSEIEAFARQLKNELGEDAAVVLIGSVARNCAMRRSDVDVLLIADQKPLNRIRVSKFEFHRFSRYSFIESLGKADDFPNWCVRYGVPLAGGKYWDEIVSSIGENTKWPEWHRKIEVAGKRWLAAKLFIDSGDLDAASESALFAFDHLIRGLLLREGIFPLSRPELIKQIKPLSPELGFCLRTLLGEPSKKIDFPRLLQSLSAALNSLDADAHNETLERLGRILARPRSEQTATNLAAL